MNTNSIPNTNSVEPQIAERLQNIYCAEFSGGALAVPERMQWCFQELGKLGGHTGWGLLGSVFPVLYRC